MSEYAEFKLNAGILKKALENAEYKKLHDQFATAIDKSLQIIKSQAQESLRSGMPSLAKYADTIASEVRMDAEEGRVKIIKGKEPGYQCKDTPNWKLHIFEGGTKIRKTKSRKIDRDAAKESYKATQRWAKAYKRVGKGHTTGKVSAVHFFESAKQQSLGRAADELTKYLSQSIEKAFNGQ